MLGVMYWTDVAFSDLKQPTSLVPAAPAQHSHGSSVHANAYGMSTQLAVGGTLCMRSQGKSCQVHGHAYMSSSPGSITADECEGVCGQ